MQKNTMTTRSTFTVSNLCYALLLLLLLPAGLRGQTIFNRFDFNDIPLTMASIGPAAISADPNSTSSSNAAYINNFCGATKGIDLLTNNFSGIYNQPQMGMAFRFRRLETRAEFFVRGGMQFYVDNGQLMIAYRTYNNSGNGFTDYGPFNTGYTLPSDNNFHVYDFLYTQSTGIGRVNVDGVTVWSNNGPNNRALYWVGATPGIIGTAMDGNCNGIGILDYAYFYTPDAPLAVDFVDFQVEPIAANNELRWKAFNAAAHQDFIIERSQDGNSFTEIGQVPALDTVGIQSFSYTDLRPGTGTWFYRIRQTDNQGATSVSEIREVQLTQSVTQEVLLWPNPATDRVHVQLSAADPNGHISLFNSGGTVVFSQPLDGAQIDIPLDTFRPGLYFIRYTRQGQQYTEKLVIQ